MNLLPFPKNVPFTDLAALTPSTIPSPLVNAAHYQQPHLRESTPSTHPPSPEASCGPTGLQVSPCSTEKEVQAASTEALTQYT